MAKKPNQLLLRKKADAIFSRYIRQRDKGVCFTCGLVKHWKEMQNGHFIPRQYLATRFSEDNCACQCYACNMLFNGQPSVFSIKLREIYGEDQIHKLEAKRREVIRYFDYEKVIKDYTEKCKELGYEIK